VAVNLDEMVIRVHPGDGLIARFPGVALVLFGDDPAQRPVADELLTMVEASGNASAAPGRRLARQVARLLGDADPDDVPSFGLLAQAEHGVVLILQGDADADVSGPNGDEHLSGRQVATWVDRILEPPIDRLVISPSGVALGEPDPRAWLGVGAVPGGGLSAVPAGASEAAVPAVAPPPAERAPRPAPVPPRIPPRVTPAPAPPRPRPTPPPPPAPPSVLIPAADAEADETAVDMEPAPPASLGIEADPGPVEPFVSVMFGDEEPEEVREPLPVASEAPSIHADHGPDHAVVQGVVCSRGHFNDPSAPFCSVCGISMVQKTLNLVNGPRPPLGVLVLDDGATFSVDIAYVLGREPEADPDVVAGKARALIITDPDRTVGRLHAALVLHNWDVQVVDRNSVNGTFIASPGQDDWARLTPNQPTTIKPGTRIRLGQRILLYDSHGGKR
jgi:hypothetical protein